MRIDEQHDGDVTVLALSGRLVLGDATERLNDKTRSLLFEGCRQLVFDLGAVSMIDSGGLGQLLTSFNSARNLGGDVKLAALSNRANNLLVTTKLDVVFDRLETADAAVKSFAH